MEGRQGRPYRAWIRALMAKVPLCVVFQPDSASRGLYAEPLKAQWPQGNASSSTYNDSLPNALCPASARSQLSFSLSHSPSLSLSPRCLPLFVHVFVIQLCALLPKKKKTAATLWCNHGITESSQLTESGTSVPRGGGWGIQDFCSKPKQTTKKKPVISIFHDASHLVYLIM